MGSYERHTNQKPQFKGNQPIFCNWCQQWKHGHIVKTIHHEIGTTEHGTDVDTTDVKWKIHKHQKGDNLCKGSDKTFWKYNEN